VQRRLLIACVLVSGCTLTNPAFDEPDGGSEDTTSGAPGDGDPGDGDSGDGDGDGDGDPGDGDGDPACLAGEPTDPYPAFHLKAVGGITAMGAPEFDAYAVDCHALTICSATQGNCTLTSSFLGRYRSGGNYGQGNPSGMLIPIKLQFHGGPASCGLPLVLGAQQSFELVYNIDGSTSTIDILVPCIDGDTPPLYVAEDGSTFWDAGLTQPAALWP
jgi:hypothetical protein